MTTEYEKELLELIPESTLIINTEKFDGYVQSAELALFLLENHRRVEILEISARKLFKISLKSKIAYRILVGNVEKEISKFVKKSGLRIRTIHNFELAQLLLFNLVRHRGRFELDDYEWNCYRASVRNRDYQSVLSELKSNGNSSIPKKHLFFFKAALLVLRKVNPAHVVITNGRFLEQTLIYLACRRLEIGVTMLEGGGRPYTFELFESSPHKASDYRKRIYAFNASFESKQKRVPSIHDQGISWLGEASNDPIIKSFAKRQRDSIDQVLELKGFNLSKTVIYYTSSLWEFPSIPEFGHVSPIEPHRNNVLNLAKACKELSLQLLVKVHPNPDNPEYEYFENTFWGQLCKSLNIGYLPAESTVKTSALIRACWINVVEASGVSLECVARGAPIITLAETPWFSPLDVPIPTNYEELKDQLRLRRRYPSSLVDAFLNYRNHGGISYKHFQVTEEAIRLKTGETVASSEKFNRISRRLGLGGRSNVQNIRFVP